jgi:hypothetical protein
VGYLEAPRITRENCTVIFVKSKLLDFFTLIFIEHLTTLANQTLINIQKFIFDDTF